MADVQKWSIKGQWFDVCRCSIPCPCSWAEPPDDDYCEGLLAWHIQQGQYGDVNLDGLNVAAQNILLPAASEAEWAPQPSDASMRVFSVAEQDHLGADCLGFISFLEGAGVLPAALREIVVDRAMAAPGDPVPLEALKIIVLMVYWRFGHEPDALILDELCDDSEERVAH